MNEAPFAKILLHKADDLADVVFVCEQEPVEG